MADTLTAPANLIAGEWRPSAAGDTYEKRNPARPDEVVGEFPSSTREDVDLAVQAAEDARREWARGPIARRAGVLTAAAALIEQARRGDRAGHDARDGQAAARGAHGGRAGGADPALLGGRGVPARSASCSSRRSPAARSTPCTARSAWSA